MRTNERIKKEELFMILGLIGVVESKTSVNESHGVWNIGEVDDEASKMEE